MASVFWPALYYSYYIPYSIYNLIAQRLVIFQSLTNVSLFSALSGALKVFTNGTLAGSDNDASAGSYSISHNQQLLNTCRYSYISDFAIWWKTLTHQQIKHLYNNG